MAFGVRYRPSSLAAATAIAALIRVDSNTLSTSRRYKGDGLSASRIPASSAYVRPATSSSASTVFCAMRTGTTARAG